VNKARKIEIALLCGILAVLLASASMYASIQAESDDGLKHRVDALEDKVAELEYRIEVLENASEPEEEWLVEDFGGSYEIYENGTIRLQSPGGGGLGSPITLYKELMPTEDFTISLKVKANQLGGFALFLRASLPFAGSTHGINFEFGIRDGGTFLLARSAGGWTWTIFATGTEDIWYTMKLTVYESPFSIKGEVFDESETLIGSLTISDMTNFGFSDIRYVGFGCWIPSEFLVKDFDISS